MPSASPARLAALAALLAGSAQAAPCDVFAAGGTPCVAAHSVVRALYGAYNGPLYLLRRASDSHTAVVATTRAGGFANVATQAAFCKGTSCVVWRIFDQSPFANDLSIAPPGGYVPKIDNGVNASRWPVSVGGNKVFGAYFEGAMGYRIDATNSVATGNEPATYYMVTSGTHVNGGCACIAENCASPPASPGRPPQTHPASTATCTPARLRHFARNPPPNLEPAQCFDYGNAESDNHDDGAGTMEAVYFGTATAWGKGKGTGPWVMADMGESCCGFRRAVCLRAAAALLTASPVPPRHRATVAAAQKMGSSPATCARTTTTRRSRPST